MNLFIIKKEINIYRLNRVFVFISILFFSSNSFAQNSEDLTSFCFESNVSLKEVVESLNVLLLAKDKVESRQTDQCIDIISTPDRLKLFEKFLVRRYSLKKDPSEPSPTIAQCLIELRTTKKIKRNQEQYKIATASKVETTEAEQKHSSSMDLLLGANYPGEMSVGDEKLNVTCTPVGNKAELSFSYVQKEKATLKSVVTLKKNEWLNVASVIKDLNDKNKTLGIPETQYSSMNLNEEIIYEIQYK